MLKIGFLIGNLDVHGSTRRVIEMSNALVARGHWVTVYVTAGKAECYWLPCAARILPASALRDESHHALIFCGATSEAYDLIESARCVVRMLYVLALDERNTDALLPCTSGPTRRFVQAASSPAWVLMANSTWQWEWLCQNVRPDAKLLIGGINRTIFHPEHTEHDPARPIVLASGRKRGREGTATVKAALDFARGVHPEIVLETYANKGYTQDQMRRAYCEADVFVDGQEYAGWANAPIEAMACGTPVVCTNIGGVRDFAVHDETALVVPIGDASAMGEAIVRLLDDAELRARLRSNALTKAELFRYDYAALKLELMIAEAMRNEPLS